MPKRLTQEEMSEKAKSRSPNHDRLPAEEQWLEDKELGILDWDGETNGVEDVSKVHRP